MRTARIPLLLLCFLSLAALAACGGGGSTSSSTPIPTPPPLVQTLAITSDPALPGTLQGRSYSVTLSATGGQGRLHWSTSTVNNAPLNGSLAIDEATGVISGTPTVLGTTGFTVTVTDSSSPAQSASKFFTLSVNLALTVSPTRTLTLLEFAQEGVYMSPTGGVTPFTYSFDQACMPPGFKSNLSNIYGAPGDTIMRGAVYRTGTYQCTITIQDSYSPPEVATQVVTITVIPPDLLLINSLPTKIALNRPFSGHFVAIGGVPPYTYSVSGSLPPGLSLMDPATGQVGGTPTAAGSYSFSATVSESTAKVARQSFTVTVSAPLGRNDTPGTATAIGNGTVTASVSPYIDPPNGTPAPGDNDYYKLVSLGGATVHIETRAKRLQDPILNPAFQDNPLDTVIEIVDGNGHQLSTCNQPGGATTNFSSPCVNDDISATPQHVQDSALDFQVPGASSVATTFYVHVLDWRGDARPDMTYLLNVSGVLPPP